VIQSELAFELLVVELDFPPQSGEAGEPLGGVSPGGWRSSSRSASRAPRAIRRSATLARRALAFSQSLPARTRRKQNRDVIGSPSGPSLKRDRLELLGGRLAISAPIASGLRPRGRVFCRPLPHRAARGPRRSSRREHGAVGRDREHVLAPSSVKARAQLVLSPYALSPHRRGRDRPACCALDQRNAELRLRLNSTSSGILALRLRSGSSHQSPASTAPSPTAPFPGSRPRGPTRRSGSSRSSQRPRVLALTPGERFRPFGTRCHPAPTPPHQSPA